MPFVVEHDDALLRAEVGEYAATERRVAFCTAPQNASLGVLLRRELVPVHDLDNLAEQARVLARNQLEALKDASGIRWQQPVVARQPTLHGQVRRDHEEGIGEASVLAARDLVEPRPRDRHPHHVRLASAGGELDRPPFNMPRTG
jgi:hypothetical protein